MPHYASAHAVTEYVTLKRQHSHFPLERENYFPASPVWELVVGNYFQSAHCNNERWFGLDVRRNSRHALKATASDNTHGKKNSLQFSFICISIGPCLSSTPQLYSLFEYKTVGGSNQHQPCSPSITHLSPYFTKQHKTYSPMWLKAVKTPIRWLTSNQKHYVDISNVLGDLRKIYLTS